METKNYLDNFIAKLTLKIQASQNEWKGSRFASGHDSDSEGEDDDFGQYEQFMEKYRGKNGDLKPLGLLLYRKFVWNLVALFLLLTLVSLPAAIVYSSGEGLADFQTSASFSKSILLFSIANLPYYRFDNLTEDNLSGIQLHRALTISTDIVSIILILAFILHWKVVSTNIANDYAAKSPSPHLYCLQVSNIQGRTQQQLKNHFKKFGKLAQISCVRSSKSLLVQLTKLVKLVTKYKHTKQICKQQQIISNIQRDYSQLADSYLKEQVPRIKQSFICYQQIKTRNKVADLYRYDIMPQKLSIDEKQQSHAHFQEMEQPQQKTIEHKTLPKVEKCRFQPLTLNWENFDIDPCSQILKTICQASLLVLMLFMILIALFLLNINSSHIKQQLRQNSFAVDNNSGSTAYTAMSDDTKRQTTLTYQQILSNKNNAQIVYTFCASLTYSTFKWEYYDLCTNYFSTERNRFALMLVFSLLVAVINLLTNRILWALVAFRQYRTLAERNRFLIKSIFLFSLINSAILILFIREQHIGPILRSIVGSIFGFSQQVMKVTLYPQFNRQWYLNIGNQLMMNYVVSLIVFPHFHIILHWVRKKFRQYQSNKKGKPANDPNFNYCTFYAMSLKAIFFAMIYSSCMPVFFLLCFFALNVQLYVGKFLMKKFVQQPVFVDNNAISVATDLIPYSLLLHCFANIFFLNVDEIFPTQGSYFNMKLSFFDRNIRRVQRGSIYVLIMILIALFIWNRRRIYKIIVKYWLGRDSSKIQCDLNMKFSQLKSNPAFLSSYKMKDNPKYKILYFSMILFEGHMTKIRQKTFSLIKHSVDSERSDSSANTDKLGIHIPGMDTIVYEKNSVSQNSEAKQQQNQQSHQNNIRQINSDQNQQKQQKHDFQQPLASTQNFYAVDAHKI